MFLGSINVFTALGTTTCFGPWCWPFSGCTGTLITWLYKHMWVVYRVREGFVWVRDLVYVNGGCVDWGYSRYHAIRKICPSWHIAKSKTGFIIFTLLYSNMKYLYLCASGYCIVLQIIVIFTKSSCLYYYLISVSLQPEDGQHQWPKHVVVPNVINTFILPRNTVVLDIHTYTCLTLLFRQHNGD
jgi:hypothetical protein